MNYDNAATIGLRQYVPGWSGSYLDILNQDTAWRVFDPTRLNAAPEEVARRRTGGTSSRRGRRTTTGA